MTARDFSRELLDYYDYYAHGETTEREFLNLAAKYAVDGMTALVLFNLLKPNYVLAAQAEFIDPDILAEYITYPSPRGHGDVWGYLVKPVKMTGSVPAVVVVHGNRGLDLYIEDVTRRVAKAGFMTFAPDGLSSVGGHSNNDDRGRELQQQVDPVRLVSGFSAAIEFVQHYSGVTGKVGITGFCYGDGVSNAVVVAFPELTCAASFYRRQAPASGVPKISVPLLLHYTQLDTRINEGWPVYKTALKASKKVYETYIYPGANHGFHNGSTSRYDKTVADLAWERILTWFNKYLR